MQLQTFNKALVMIWQSAFWMVLSKQQSLCKFLNSFDMLDIVCRPRLDIGLKSSLEKWLNSPALRAKHCHCALKRQGTSSILIRYRLDSGSAFENKLRLSFINVKTKRVSQACTSALYCKLKYALGVICDHNASQWRAPQGRGQPLRSSKAVHNL